MSIDMCIDMIIDMGVDMSIETCIFLERGGGTDLSQMSSPHVGRSRC